MQKNDYAAELRAAGVETIHTMVIAFDGKQVIVESGNKKATKKAGVLRNVGAAVKKAVKKTAKAKKP